MRLTIPRAVGGFGGEASHSASARRRPDVRPSAGGISIGGFPYVAAVTNPGFMTEPLALGSPRIRKYDGGASYLPGPSCRKVPVASVIRHFGQPMTSSPSPSGA